MQANYHPSIERISDIERIGCDVQGCERGTHHPPSSAALHPPYFVMCQESIKEAGLDVAVTMKVASTQPMTLPGERPSN